MLNWDFYLLVKNTRMEWETMSILDLVNLANQLACTLDEPLERKTNKILNFQLWEMKVPIWNQKPPYFFYYANNHVTGKEIVKNLSISGIYSCLTSKSNVLIPSDCDLKNCRGSFESSLLINSEEKLSWLGEFCLSVLIDTRAILSVLNPTAIKWAPSWSTKTVQIVEL